VFPARFRKFPPFRHAIPGVTSLKRTSCPFFGNFLPVLGELIWGNLKAKAKAFYEKKTKATHPVSARKALAHKLARACYWIMKQGTAYDEQRLFS
jgi:hypothetical protein